MSIEAPWMQQTKADNKKPAMLENMRAFSLFQTI